MDPHRSARPLPHIPPPPRWARRSVHSLAYRGSGLTALQEASVAGSLGLAVSWGLAELALLLV
jgi:hypothetical protein